jgi:cell division protein FtsB
VGVRTLRRTGEPGGQARTRFVFLVLGLLGGGLLCLLLVNTILATGSFRINTLQQQNLTLSQRERALEAQITAEQSPSELARRAMRLGMVEPPLIHFLNLRSGRIQSQPAHMKGIPAVPGYTP